MIKNFKKEYLCKDQDIRTGLLSLAPCAGRSESAGRCWSRLSTTDLALLPRIASYAHHSRLTTTVVALALRPPSAFAHPPWLVLLLVRVNGLLAGNRAGGALFEAQEHGGVMLDDALRSCF